MDVVLTNNGVWEYTQTDNPKPITLDARALAQWKKATTRDKRIILEGVKNHVVSNLYGKETPLQCGEIS